LFCFKILNLFSLAVTLREKIQGAKKEELRTISPFLISEAKRFKRKEVVQAILKKTR